MGLPADAIESRLEGLKLDDRRLIFDSKLRAFRKDRNTPPEVEKTRVSKVEDKLDPGYSVEQVISLLEDLSRRIDALEKKDRLLTEEIRRRALHDRKQRALYFGGCLVASVLIALGGALGWY